MSESSVSPATYGKRDWLADAIGNALRGASDETSPVAVKLTPAAWRMVQEALSVPSETPRSDAEIQLQAWHRVFETTQLSHAHARLQAAEEKAARSARRLSVPKEIPPGALEAWVKAEKENGTFADCYRAMIAYCAEAK